MIKKNHNVVGLKVNILGLFPSIWRLTFANVVLKILGADAPLLVPVLAVAVDVSGEAASGDVLDHTV